MNYSKKTVNVMALAAKAAREFRESNTEFRHVLLGILQAGDSVTASVLEAHGITLQIVQEKIQQKAAGNRVSHSHGEKSDFLNNIMAKPEEEAMKLGSNQICPAHIVLGALDNTVEWMFLSHITQTVRNDKAEIRQEIIAGLAAKEANKQA